MRLPVLLVIVAALATLAVVVILGMLAIQPPRSLIVSAEFSAETITPNADGQTDVAVFRYTLSRNAQVTIAFEAEDGTRYLFRNEEDRAHGDYQVEFSGIVSGFSLPNETINGEILQRLIPNGRYTWRLTAVSESGETDERSGVLNIQDGEATLPDILRFSVSPNVF
jgi:hypothetical protein